MNYTSEKSIACDMCKYSISVHYDDDQRKKTLKMVDDIVAVALFNTEQSSFNFQKLQNFSHAKFPRLVAYRWNFLASFCKRIRVKNEYLK